MTCRALLFGVWLSAFALRPSFGPRPSVFGFPGVSPMTAALISPLADCARFGPSAFGFLSDFGLRISEFLPLPP